MAIPAEGLPRSEHREPRPPDAAPIGVAAAGTVLSMSNMRTVMKTMNSPQRRRERKETDNNFSFFAFSAPLRWMLFVSFLLVQSAGASDVAYVEGITEPFLDVTLSASVPGIITIQKFKEGDAVKEGDVIIELDKRLEELETARRKLVAENKRTDME